MRTEMREPTFLVLAALADQPRHGYGVQQEVTQMSGGTIRLKTSTLYAALDRLRDDGWLREVRQEFVDGRLRRYYDLTNAGRSALTAEVEQLDRRANEARRRLSHRPVTA
jgi:PadR family transcriptional regulator PadR